MTEAAKQIIEIETDFLLLKWKNLATGIISRRTFRSYKPRLLQNFGMIIAPCSMTLGGFANGYLIP